MAEDQLYTGHGEIGRLAYLLVSHSAVQLLEQDDPV